MVLEKHREVDIVVLLLVATGIIESDSDKDASISATTLALKLRHKDSVLKGVADFVISNDQAQAFFCDIQVTTAGHIVDVVEEMAREILPGMI